jgi:hypothetical protein
VLHKSAERDPRLDAEWLVVSALRGSLNLALGPGGEATYAEALALGEKVAPALLNRKESVLFREQESEFAKYYRELAAVQSKPRKPVSPVELIDEEIRRHENLLGRAREGRDHEIRKHLRELRDARDELAPTRQTETRILQGIVNTYRKLPWTERGNGCTEVRLSEERALRLRVLHPEISEGLTGADIIFEHYDKELERARIVAMQFKLWDGRSLYHNERLNAQLDRLNATFCSKGWCHEGGEGRRWYRFPFCAAFLRPTDQLQAKTSRLSTSGYHIPICLLRELWQETRRGGLMLHADILRRAAVAHRAFDDLFHAEFLGSRWINWPELEALYREHRVLEPSETAKIHVQSFPFSPRSKLTLRRPPLRRR